MDHDCGQQIGEGHFARGKDGPAGDAELVVTGGALEFAAGYKIVTFRAAATRADCFALCFGPAHLAKGLISHIFAHAEHGLEAECAGGGGEEKVLHVIVSSAYALHMMATCTLVNGKRIAYDAKTSLGIRCD